MQDRQMPHLRCEQTAASLHASILDHNYHEQLELSQTIISHSTRVSQASHQLCHQHIFLYVQSDMLLCLVAQEQVLSMAPVARGPS